MNQELRDKLIEITTDLGYAYEQNKEAELLLKGKDRTKDKVKIHDPGLRDDFFTAATEAAKATSLARKTLKATDPTLGDEASARDYFSRNWPEWIVIDVEKPDDEPVYRAVIEENPEFKPFTFVNPNDGKVYARQVNSPSLMLDIERLKTSDPRLWEEVSYEPEPQRVPKSMEDLTEEQREKIERFQYRSQPTLKLASPREAKPEDLAPRA